MSRIDKRMHQEKIVGTAQDASVRLFAFTNLRTGYDVCFSPENSIVVLKTKKPATSQHPCKQWEQLSSVVFESQPNNTHALFVVDTTALSDQPQYGQEEVVNGCAVGPLLKRVSNVMAKLNPHDGTLVAAGASCYLALKYMWVGEKTFGHRDRLLRRLVLVVPPSLDGLRRLGEFAARAKASNASSYPLCEIVVLLQEATEVTQWTTWLQEVQDKMHLISSFSISADLKPTLFHAISRECGVVADGTAVDTSRRFANPRTFRIDFVLSKQTKCVEQLPRPSPLDTLGYDDDEAGEYGYEDDDEDNEESEDGEDHHHHHDACGSCCGSSSEEDEESGAMMEAGLRSLPQLKDPVRIILEGRLLDLEKGLVGSTEGCIQVERLKELIDADPSLLKHVTAKMSKGPTLSLAARLVRTRDGRTNLRALEVEAMTKAAEKNSLMVGSGLAEIPASYNVSSICHSYGALLVRGRKCALTRDISKKKRSWEGLRIPFTAHSSTTESSMECAVRALCDACDVSADNFYTPSYLPPVMYYMKEADRPVHCITLFTMVAVNPSPQGPASDAVESPLEVDEPYDWVSFSKALTLLQCEAEREALREMQRNLARAHAAELYSTFPGYGVFGEEVGGSTSAGASLENTAAPASLEGLEVIVALCPGDASHRSTPHIQRATNASEVFVMTPTTSIAQLLRHGAAALPSGRMAMLVDPSVELSQFSGILCHLTDELGASAQVYTLLDQHTAESLCTLNHSEVDDEDRSNLMDALVDASRLSDALFVISLEGSVEPLSPNVEAVLACCRAANQEIRLFLGLDVSNQPLVLPELSRPVREASLPRLVHLKLESDKKVASAALGAVASVGSLSTLFTPGDSIVMMVQGEFVLTHGKGRGKTAWIALDSSSRCLRVEEEEADQQSTATTSLELMVWCSSAAVATKVESIARAMFAQLVD